MMIDTDPAASTIRVIDTLSTVLVVTVAAAEDLENIWRILDKHFVKIWTLQASAEDCLQRKTTYF